MCIKKQNNKNENNNLNVISNFNNVLIKNNIFLDEDQKKTSTMLIEFLTINQHKKQGFYLYGKVGRGKTMIVVNVLKSLQSKINFLHFHYNAFISKIREEQKSQKNLQIITKKIILNCDVIFIDEFDVLDIVDCVIIRDVLLYALKSGTKVILSSNKPTSELYKNGLQRESFLPVIAKIESDFTIKESMSQKDYRTLITQKGNNFKTFNLLNLSDIEDIAYKDFINLVEKEKNNLNQNFELEDGRIVKNSIFCKNIFFTSFESLCKSNLSMHDYRFILNKFDKIFLHSFYLLKTNEKDVVRRFIWLMDEIYESKKQVIIYSNCAINALTALEEDFFEIKRSISRLKEIDKKEF